MKETKEAIVALVLLGKFVSDRVKDGVDFSDALALGKAITTDGQFKDIVVAGYTDADKIQDEVKDMNLAKILELAQILPQISDIVSGKVVA